MEATKDMFSNRLLRKAYRPGRRHQGCPADVFQCEKEFMELVEAAKTTQPMDRNEWHGLCNEFSDKWEHICHWVHPSRLADFLTENSDLEWVGEYPVRPEAKTKTKIKSNVKAQRFKCSECDVICNSYAQYVIHSQGSRHKECVQYKARSELMKGNLGYVSPGAIPLDTAPEDGIQAYYKKDDCETSSNTDTCSTGSKKNTPSAAARARLLAMTAMMAMSLPTASYDERYYQGASDYYEQPSTNNYGWWGDYGHYENLVAPAESQFQEEGEEGAEYRDEEEEDEQPYYFNPDAKEFISRSATLPVYDYSDDSSSRLESTPAPSSGGSNAEDVDRVTSLLEGAVGRAEWNVLSTLREDEGVLAKAVVNVASSCGKQAVMELLQGQTELAELVGDELRVKVAAGTRLGEVTDDMCEVQAEHIDDANNRELTNYAALVGLAVALYVAHAVTADLLSSTLELYAKNMTHTELPPAADEHLTIAFKSLKADEKERVEVPALSVATHTRRLRSLFAMLDA